MKIGFLFPGQGAQSIGMGQDLYEKYEEVRKVYERVHEVTGIDIKKISFEGPEETLNETKNTQLAILTESLGILEILKKNNIQAVNSAGLSLGEYTALIEDEILGFDAGVQLVKKRGEIMQTQIPSGNWQMAGILGLNEKDVEDACNEVKSGFVRPANYNTIGQIVISGEETAVLEASEIAKQKGAKKASILKTTGPFHTEKMEQCAESLRKELEKTAINKKQSKVIKNLTGEQYKETDDIVDILSKHIMSPVRFIKSLQTMYENGIDTFIEIGPGRTLSGFVKRMNFENPVNIMNINNIESLETVINALK